MSAARILPLALAVTLVAFAQPRSASAQVVPDYPPPRSVPSPPADGRATTTTLQSSGGGDTYFMYRVVYGFAARQWSRFRAAPKPVARASSISLNRRQAAPWR